MRGLPFAQVDAASAILKQIKPLLPRIIKPFSLTSVSR